MRRSSGESGEGQPGQPAAVAPRGRGGLQLKPDAFSPEAKTAIRASELAKRAQPKAKPVRRDVSRVVLSRLGPAVSGVREQANETLGRVRRFQRRARVRIDDSISDARTRLRSLLAKPTNVLAELEVSARGRTIANRVEALADLDRDERELIRDFSMAETRLHQAGDELVREHEASPEPAFIASGWACRLRVHEGGRRQIMGLLLPGDSIGLREAAEPVAGTTIGALTEVHSLNARRLLSQVERSNRYSNLERAIQRAEAQEKDFLTNQIARLGGMRPYDRLVDLMRELRWRLGQAGLADEREFPMPLGERDLMSVLNLSQGELNRAVARLRRWHGFRLKRQGARMLDRDEATRISGGFRPPPEGRGSSQAPLPRIISE